MGKGLRLTSCKGEIRGYKGAMAPQVIVQSSLEKWRMGKSTRMQNAGDAAGTGIQSQGEPGEKQEGIAMNGERGNWRGERRREEKPRDLYNKEKNEMCTHTQHQKIRRQQKRKMKE